MGVGTIADVGAGFDLIALAVGARALESADKVQTSSKKIEMCDFGLLRLKWNSFFGGLTSR